MSWTRNENLVHCAWQRIVLAADLMGCTVYAGFCFRYDSRDGIFTEIEVGGMLQIVRFA